MIMKIKKIVLILIFLIIVSPVYSELFWDGRFYDQAMFLFQEQKKHIYTTYIGFSILNLKMDAQPSDILRVRSELEYTLLHSTDAFLLAASMDGVNVNTLNASITPEDFKFVIGRFIPAWGKVRIFRPLDIFIPQTYFLNQLSFKGIDGVSAKYYISNLSSIELIAIPSMDIRGIVPFADTSPGTHFLNEINHTVAAFNMEMHLAAFDNNLIYMNDTASPVQVAGFAFKGDAILGWWGEFFSSFNTKQKIHTFKASVGADYSFAKYYFITVEYFYDQSGMKDYKDYFILRILPRMTFSQQYLMADFNIMTYLEMNIGVTFIENLLDKSFILFPYYQYEIIENCFLGLSLYHFNGKSGREFSPDFLGNYVFNTFIAIRF